MPAIPLPNGMTQFSDENGKPYAGGRVYFYIPSTFTPKDTWQDYGQTITNSNPVTLDAAGRALIWGNGRYRQILQSFDGVSTYTQVWDQETATLINLGTDIVLTFSGGPPSSAQWLGGEAISRTIILPANLVGSVGVTPKTLPTATFIVTMKQNGTNVATASCSTGGAWTFATTSGLAVTLSPNDDFDFYAPVSTDATVANFGLTILGNFSPS